MFYASLAFYSVCIMRAHLLLPALGLVSLVGAFPLRDSTPAALNLTERCVDCTDPVQPDWDNAVPSCAVCRPQWPSISSCAAASSVFKDASRIMWCVTRCLTNLTSQEPAGIRQRHQMCLHRHLPLCLRPVCRLLYKGTSSADPDEPLTEQTGQCEAYLNVGAEEAPSVVEGIRSTCGFGSVLMGGVGYSSAAPAPTATSPARAAATLASGAVVAASSGAAIRASGGVGGLVTGSAAMLAVLVGL